MLSTSFVDFPQLIEFLYQLCMILKLLLTLESHKEKFPKCFQVRTGNIAQNKCQRELPSHSQSSDDSKLLC